MLHARCVFVAVLHPSRTSYLFTYFCPSLPLKHKSSTTPRHRTLFWAVLAIPGQLVPCCFTSASTVARPASLPLPQRIPGQGLACSALCWLPEGVSDPAPLLPQHMFGHWFLSSSLPQIFVSDFLLPLDFIDAPQTGVEECLTRCCIVCVVCHASHP